MKIIIQRILVSIMMKLLVSSLVIAMDLPIKHIVSGESLKVLYSKENGSYFYVSGMKNSPLHEITFFKELLNGNGFRTVQWAPLQFDWSRPDWAGKDWSDQDWQKNQYKLMYGVKNQEEESLLKEAKEHLSEHKSGGLNADLLWVLINHRRYKDNRYSLDELSARLVNAKNVIKSFVSSYDKNVHNQGIFVKKNMTLNRLFTYAKLQHVIIEKKLTHVRLPFKIFCIKNARLQEYVSAEDALKIIDNGLQMCLYEDFTWSIEFVSDVYQAEIFASREKKEGKGLSNAAMEDLTVLCKEAPFDIGYDNIFWDACGNAIIIDTEYKDAQVRDYVKLARYPVDSALV